MKITELLTDYKQYLEQEKQLAHNTVRGYLSDLRELAAVVSADVEHITVKDLRGYVRHLKSLGRARRTVLRKMHGLTSFWEWCQINGTVERVIPPLVPLPGKPPRKVPKTLTVEELKRFAEIEGETAEQTAAFRLLAWLGLRRRELLDLRVDDVDLLNSRILVRGKGEHERLLTIPNGLRLELAALIEQRPAGGWLFPSVTKDDGPWSAAGLTYAFNRHMTRCGLDGRGISPHWLRHSFATHMINAGVAPHIVQRLLGHTRLETTMIYVHMAQHQLDDAMNQHVLSEGEPTDVSRT